MSDLGERLTGAWSLVKWTVSFDDGRPPVQPFGAGATGRILYTPPQNGEGIMNAILMAAGHPEMPLKDGAAWANILSRYMHYSGRWRIEGDAAVHAVDYAVDPSLIGRDLVRKVTFEGDELILSGADKSPRTGGVIHHEVRWCRDQG